MTRHRSRDCPLVKPCQWAINDNATEPAGVILFAILIAPPPVKYGTIELPRYELPTWFAGPMQFDLMVFPARIENVLNRNVNGDTVMIEPKPMPMPGIQMTLDRSTECIGTPSG